jgi:predicted ATP-grasp superfamily ATP-dependent carboligase
MNGVKVELWGKVKKNPILIEGFPGFGLVSTIVSEYLIDHLNAKQIGRLTSTKIPPIIAVHKGKVIEPLAIFYAEKENILILRSIASVNKVEWEISDAMLELADKLDGEEIISIEGVGSEIAKKAEPKVFFYTDDAKKKKKLESVGLKELDEGIIVGVTGALLSKQRDASFLFVESYADMPDSRAAAKVIEVLDKYLNLDIDYKPLLQKAASFEEKIKDVLMKGVEASKQKEEKESYLG